MPQHPYFESAVQLACESSLACLVLLGSENNDIELVRIKPQPPAEFPSPEDFTARKLRTVGTIGLQGTKPAYVFKEPLEPRLVNAIATAFLEYVRVLLGEHLTAQIEAAEVAGLERLYALSDTRPN